ncbi:DUF3099 domain-containing protein [Streptomyces sp. NRRL B-3648]|uniref:DUF3099 domain-containing protein n=1 Tax=Streptomyces sp. NRRL B-3648 TaxID=1519493 RepID=UPI0006B058A5|nr:DUF3099 domain-containing protein [Streptomyces sp. NRRL B-3648]KOV95780.1 membrane protein [Streptomyces sp. NRRL B-3648]
MRKQHGGNVQVFRITGARTGLAEDVRGRQRRYVISMSVRTVSVILAVSLWNVERYVAIVALVLGAVLPYIAVVVANAGRERPPSLPSTFVATPVRPMIAPSGAGEERDTARESVRESARESEQRSASRPGARTAPEDVPPSPAAGVRGERPDPL